MSTYLYLQCLDHDPPLPADEESGQHLSDLPAIRAAIAGRSVLMRAGPGWGPTGYFAENTRRFLVAHHSCRIGIVDEYGVEHPLEVP